MFWNKLQVLAIVAMIATGLGAFLLGQWASADGPRKTVEAATATAQPGKPNADEPPVPAGRREAVIRMPVGTFVKEVEVQPYGSGRITWTYENDRVRGHIALAGMGAEVELATEAEISMASNGTIYGIVTGFKVTHVKLPAEMKGEFAGVDLVKAWPLVEPLVNDVMTDLPFSYSFRIVGDRLTILNYRILLAGPNPLGKLGGLATGKSNDALAAIAYFQAIGTAIEGSYTATDPDKEKEIPKKRPITSKSLFPTPRNGN